MTEPFSLKIEDVTAKIQGTALFRPVSLALAKGQIAFIRGDNGAGKSTLLRMIAGLLPVTNGNIHYVDDIVSPSGRPAAHLLGHENGLKNNETAGQALAFWARIAAMSGPVPGDKAISRAAIARELNLLQLLNLPVRVLSAGQKRRLAFARLLLDKRPLWLLDEPTSAMDVESCKIIDMLTRAYLHDGGLVIAATHQSFLDDRAGGIASKTLILERPPFRRPPPTCQFAMTPAPAPLQAAQDRSAK